MSDFLLSIYPELRALWVVWFMVLFLGMVFWVMRPSKKRDWENAAAIPLREGPPRRGPKGRGSI